METAFNLSSNVVGSSGNGGGNAELGSMLLNISEKLVSSFVQDTPTEFNKTVRTSTMEADIQAVGPEKSSDSTSVNLLTVKDNTVSVNLSAVAENNDGSAALMFMSLNGLDKFLSPRYFPSENSTSIYSDVVTATLLKTSNTTLPEPLNFTLPVKVTRI
ncbi:adhesion G protein-coupled receptor E3-like [Arapaima gigas]